MIYQQNLFAHKLGSEDFDENVIKISKLIYIWKIYTSTSI